MVFHSVVRSGSRWSREERGAGGGILALSLETKRESCCRKTAVGW
jgi:hypothetical protein